MSNKHPHSPAIVWTITQDKFYILISTLDKNIINHTVYEKKGIFQG